MGPLTDAPSRPTTHAGSETVRVAAVEPHAVASAAATEAGPSPDFLAALSHELRNPLSGITTALALADSVPMEPALGRALRVIQRQANELLLLAEQLTDLSQLEGGQLRLDQARFDLVDLVSDARPASAPLLNGRSQQLDERLPGAPLWVAGDRRRLLRVIVGLIGEVARHAQARAVIDLQLERDGGQARLVIADREAPGERLPLDDAPMVSASHGRGRRLATNLAVITRLVHLHRGSIAATHLDDHAPRAFEVRLPLA